MKRLLLLIVIFLSACGQQSITSTASPATSLPQGRVLTGTVAQVAAKLTKGTDLHISAMLSAQSYDDGGLISVIPIAEDPCDPMYIPKGGPIIDCWPEWEPIIPILGAPEYIWVDIAICVNAVGCKDLVDTMNAASKLVNSTVLHRISVKPFRDDDNQIVKDDQGNTVMQAVIQRTDTSIVKEP